MALGFTDLTEIQVREIHHGLKLREQELKKAKKTNAGAGLSTHDAEYHLAILQGDDTSPGLIYLAKSQLDAIFESDLRARPKGKGDQLEAPIMDGGNGETPAEDVATGEDGPTWEERLAAATADEPLMFALDHALHNAVEEFPSGLEGGTPEPMTDAALRAHIGAAFGDSGARDKDAPSPFAWRGGKRPALWLGQLNWSGTPDLSGDLLLAVVRARYDVPVPQLAEAPPADVPPEGDEPEAQDR